ncbi:ATP-binding cassette domain-containing protein [Labrys monachus]|uniref:Ribose transport system ATP-binding protein n=1 Tax=Labrys monachus TaxID=217067 RepID=A0ABU0FEA7_9HYPH|nr:ATP-binding cassette domain-containing protein [Labrys monachus]MDQ0392489.1 ribose transport system ATP-binding protein [Labrys monachus]
MAMTQIDRDVAGAAPPPAPPVLECRNIRKVFPGVVALDGVDVAITRGEIHAFVGQNGAGKSTLVKVLTGVYPASEGEILVDGVATRIASPVDAEAAGIVIVHQDQQLVGQFDITRNIFLGREMSRAGLLDFAAMGREAEDLLRRVGAGFPATTLVRDLSVAQRELVAIAAALARRPRVLILDEPTASLSNSEADHLFGIIRGLRESGVTIIYISHYLDEVFDLVDRITVLRDGRLVSTSPVGKTSRQRIIDEIVGRSLSQLYPKEAVPLGAPLLEVRGLSQGKALRDVSLSIRGGEIFGIAGLMGAGRTELAMALVGALPRSGGDVMLQGKPSRPRSPREAKNAGFALIPEDRRHEGLVTDLSVRENLSLPNIGRFATFGLLDLAREKASALDLVDRLKIATPSIRQITRNLSGGNQQKIVIGRWLTGNAKVFIFDEPTTGVDVGSKVEIYRQMTEVARQGAAVIFISSDFEELVGMCDRVAVMRKGEIVSTHEAAGLDVPGLMYLATESGGPAEAPGAGTAAGSPRGAGAFLTRWGTIAGMAIVLAAIGAVTPDFLAPANLLDVLKQGSLLAFIALGLTAVLVAGGFDMSAGAVSQLAANLAAGTVAAGFGSAAALAIGAGAGLAAGLCNAVFVLVLRMPPFVATLGSMFVAMGLSLLYNGGQALTLYDQPAFFFIGQGYLGPVPFIAVILAVTLLILHILFKHTPAGLRMYAVGENLAAAELRGIDRRRAVVASFAIGGIVLGLSGVVLASYSYGASALATGLDFLISALAAAFLGTSLSRTGELDMIGTTIAAIFLAALANGLVLMGVSNLALPGIQGSVLILSILLGVIHKRGIGQVTIF